MAWLVLRLTDRGSAVGWLTAAQFLPVVLLSAWAGAVADRIDQRRAVLVVQASLGGVAALLSVLVITDRLELWMLYVLAVAQGVGMAFDTPTRQSFVGQIVGNDDLRNALSLNAGLVQVARVVGPAAAGLLIQAVGTDVCFVINAISYGVVFLAVTSIRLTDGDASAAQPRTTTVGRSATIDGIKTIGSRPELRNLFALALVVGLAAANTTVTLPILVRTRFDGNARTFGLLAATVGLGALCGAIATTRRAPTKGMLLRALGALGLALLVCSLDVPATVVGVALGASGLVGLMLGVTLNASLQLGAPADMRGRVIGLYFTVAFGANVIGGPMAGYISEHWRPGASFATSAALVFATLACFLRSWRHVHHDPVVLPAPGPTPAPTSVIAERASLSERRSTSLPDGGR